MWHGMVKDVNELVSEAECQYRMGIYMLYMVKARHHVSCT